MSLSSRIRKAALSLGIEINRFNPVQSARARLIRQLRIHDVDLVVDIGANDGGYGRILRESGYRGEILSFEPLGKVHRALCASTARDSCWEVAPRMALGDESGESAINVAGNSTSSSFLPMLKTHLDAAPQSQYQAVELVNVQRLDGLKLPLLIGARRMFVKIDVQGFEMPVLNGSIGMLPKISGFQIEASLLPLYEGQCLYHEIVGWMSRHGYELWSVVPGFSDAETGRMLQMDCIFFHSGER